MFWIKIEFNGCSCGCTESEVARIKSEDESEMKKAAAYFTYMHMTMAKNQFNRLSSIPDDIKAMALAASNLCVKQCDIQSKISSIDFEIKQIDDAVKTLGFPAIPDLKLPEYNILKSKKVALEQEIAEFEKQIQAIVGYDQSKVDYDISEE